MSGERDGASAPRDAVDITTSMAQENGFDTGPPNGVNGLDRHGTTLTNGDAKPDTWIPIEEHVLWKPTRKVKAISIGAGFSGMFADPQ